MEKIYGYKQEDLIALAKAVSERANQNLTQIFKDYAIKSGKAQGTVRNVYYALVKLSQKDEQFTKKYLGGKPLCAAKIMPFERVEEDWLIKTVNAKRGEGFSVRSIINELSGGDVKLALRYQNKYRSALAKGRIKSPVRERDKTIDGVKFSEATILKLKKDINALMERVSASLRKENDFLKSRIDFLEKENLRLNKLLYGSTEANVVKYFSPPTAVKSQGNVQA